MKLKKELLILLGVFMITLTACSKGATNNGVAVNDEELENVNAEGMPIVKDTIQLEFFAGQHPATNEDWNDVMIFNEYEDMTDIDIDWQMVPTEGLDEQRNLALGGGELPDAFHSAHIPSNDLRKYGEQGIFIPLNDLIKEYAPNFQKVLDEYPDIRKAITMPDGNIYAFPTIHDPEFTAMVINSKPWYREDWLEELGMDIPETTDEFYDYLKAVKETDLMGDGKNEEIPFGSKDTYTIVEWLKGAFGIGNRGSTSGNFDMDPDSDKLRFIPTTDNYKQLLDYLHKLYDEELIEQSIFSIEHDQYFSNGAEGKYGSTYLQDPGQLFSGEYRDDYIGGLPLQGPNGDDEFTAIQHPLDAPGSFAITKDNDHPVATVRWIDFFYSDEGEKMFFMGLEGETFEQSDDGGYQFVEDIRDNPDGMNLDQSVSRYLTWPGGGYPSITKEDYFKGAESSEASREAASKLEPDAVEEIWPAFSYTEEEYKKITTFGSDIEKYVSEMQDKFISGDESLDDWDEYVKTLEDMNLDEYIDIMQGAYERYKDN